MEAFIALVSCGVYGIKGPPSRLGVMASLAHESRRLVQNPGANSTKCEWMKGEML